MVIPFFLRFFVMRSICSPSKFCKSEGRASTIVTSEPKELKIEANSTPITPPPITISRLGRYSKSRIFSLSMTRGESMPSTGIRAGIEPLVIKMCFASTTLPSSSWTLCSPIIVAFWSTISTLASLRRYSTPLTNLVTVRFFPFTAWAISMVKVASEIVMPREAALAKAERVCWLWT